MVKEAQVVGGGPLSSSNVKWNHNCRFFFHFKMQCNCRFFYSFFFGVHTRGFSVRILRGVSCFFWVSICVCKYTYIYVYIYTHLCICVCIYKCTYICMHLCKYIQGRRRRTRSRLLSAATTLVVREVWLQRKCVK